VADLAEQLGFAPVTLGKLNEGGWLAGARTRPRLGPAHLPGFVQEGAVIDLRPCDRRRELVARANVFEQRATEYLKAPKSRRLGVGLTAYGRRSKRGETPDRAADLDIVLAGRARAGMAGETAVEEFGEVLALAAAA
jgi:hypothetical protein